MSTYTTEVRFICETEYGLKESVGQTKVDEILTEVAPKIFDFDFPIFDENYRLVLEKNILRHFYTREIGAETVGLWKLWLEDKMNEIMPYFNKLYEMYVVKVNPLYNFDLTRHYSGNGKTDEVRKNTFKNGAITNGNGTSNDVQKYSDTPQNGLSDVQNDRYLTSATINGGSNTSHGETTSEGGSEDNGTVTNTNEYYETVQGRSGVSVGKAWEEFLKGFRNVDSMLYKELEVLFMQLW